jgi:hypothetical protein
LLGKGAEDTEFKTAALRAAQPGDGTFFHKGGLWWGNSGGGIWPECAGKRFRTSIPDSRNGKRRQAEETFARN